MARTLIRNGWIVTVDKALGDIAGGDVLVEDDRIVAVGRDLAAADATVLDAAGMIVIPGLVNAHIHTWEIDPDPPRLRLPFLYRLAHYGGLRGYRAKLEVLLNSVPWSPARDYVLAQNGSPKRAASRPW